MFQSFRLDYLVSLWIKIINSVVVVGFYYGFLTTFFIGPSYLFPLRVRVMEEGTEKKVSAITGFITGQLIIFISIYYAPLHLALARPHTITFIAIPYLLFHFFWNNQKDYFLDYEYSRKNTLMYNLTIQMIFVNNLFVPLLNLFILPSSILFRLINIYLFQSNKKMLFLTSTFVGCLIGHILFIKWSGSLLSLIRQNYFIKNVTYFILKNKYIKYVTLKWKDYVSRIFTILLFINCLYYLGRAPVPILNEMRKLETLEPEEKESDQIEKQKEQEISEKDITIEDLSPLQLAYLFADPLPEEMVDFQKVPEEKETEDSDKIDEREIFCFEKPLVTFLFDYERWNRPSRHIKNNQFENAVRDEMSQYFFYTCQSDGKERISFMYPSSLSTFLEMIQKKMSLFTTEKISYDELDNSWNSTNEKKKYYLELELRHRYITLDKYKNKWKKNNRAGLERKMKLSNDKKTKNKYLPSMYDPLLNGSYRGQIKNEIYTKDDIRINLNKIYGILLNINTNYPKFEQIRTDPNEKTIVNGTKSSRIKQISKEVPRWSYQLIDELEQVEGIMEREEREEVILAEDHEIRSRRFKRVVIFTENSNISTKEGDKDPNYLDESDELALIRYLPQSDFQRDIIKGSMRPQRRKTAVVKPFQAELYSLLFLFKIDTLESLLDIFETITKTITKIFIILEDWMWKKNNTLFPINKNFPIYDYTIEEREDGMRIENALDVWANLLCGQILRTCLLLTHSIFRKYILLPVFIITKNIVRILLFKVPEWSEDFKDWKREIHIICTYDGVPLSETEFPKNWTTDGIQIKILFPFRLKPWHKSKRQFAKKHPMKKKTKKMDFFFLTGFGTGTEKPYGVSSSLNILSFLHPVFKELGKKKKKWKKIKMLEKKIKLFLNRNVSKETKQRIVENILSVKKNLKNLFLPELSETQKNSTINNSNQMTYESSFRRIPSVNIKKFKPRTIKDLDDELLRLIDEDEIDRLKNNNSILVPIYKNKELDLNIWELLERKNERLVRKSRPFLKFMIERAYIDIFLSIINIARMNIQLFIESTIKIIKKYIETNEERIKKTNLEKKKLEKKNQSLIHFLSNITNRNSQISSDVSSLSQIYVLYKITTNLDLQKYKFASFLEDNQLSVHPRYEIMYRFLLMIYGMRGLYRKGGVTRKDLKLYVRPDLVNFWGNWLSGFDQYFLSKNRWSWLESKKWRNRIRGMAQNKDLIKWDSYEKNQFSFYQKQEVDSLLTNQKKKLKKQYDYDRLAYEFLNYADKEDNKDSSIHLKECKLPDLTGLQKLGDMANNISMKNYLDDHFSKEKTKNNMERKYFDWRIINFCHRNKKDLEAWVDNDYYLKPHEEINPYPCNQKQKIFDWMGMNVEIINHFIPISNLQLGFFPRFAKFYDAYRNNPWVIPIELVFFNFNGKRNPKWSENKSITKNNKIDIFTLSKEQKSLETKYAGQVDLESSTLIQERDFEQDYVGSDIKGGDRKKKRSENMVETELNSILKRYWYYQLNWNGFLSKRILNNINCYSVMLRLRMNNIIEIAVSSIRRGEFSLEDVVTIRNEKNNGNLIKNGILLIEPVRLFTKNDGKFIMYQAIAPVHKSKQKINERERNKTDIDIKEDVYDLLVPDNLLSPRRSRELRILIYLTYKSRQKFDPVLYNSPNWRGLERKKELSLFKSFLWPNYRLEDLACMNRYWFDTNNGSRFSMLRLHMYPRLN
uniref:Protein TIC 214 n=1 Tax=Piliostigma thonningii TaxID=653098 RepID=A0A2S0SU42_9FABA|nr:hypothetical protein RF1 [Piliostigma thonningii]AWB12989.1 hypothetical protein RF1 [Piliostigma thonningii]